MQIMQAAEPIDRWIARTDIPPALRERLQLAQRARAFAVAELGLPDNASYRRYADLKRPAAVWNVVAAPPYCADAAHLVLPGHGLHWLPRLLHRGRCAGRGSRSWPRRGWRWRCMACPPIPRWAT